MTQTTLRGSCLCGGVRYEINGDAQRFYHCHCTRCRKVSGTGHASNLLLKLGAITWLQGEELIHAYKVPEAERFTSRFCRICGSQVPRYVKETDFMVIPAGSLDDDAPLQAQARIFWDSRASWSCSGDDLPKHAAYPEPR